MIFLRKNNLLHISFFYLILYQKNLTINLFYYCIYIYYMIHMVYCRISCFGYVYQLMKLLSIFSLIIIAFYFYFKINSFCNWFICNNKCFGKVNVTLCIYT